MAHRFNTRPIGTVTGYEPYDIPTDFTIPHCGFEDIDRALFNLFDKELQFQQAIGGDIKKVPVIYATGERAIFLRRKEPLRDRSGMLILPLISILRSGLEQKSVDGFGHGPGIGDIVIKNRISPQNLNYKRFKNEEGLQNQDNTFTGDKHKGFSRRGLPTPQNPDPLLINELDINSSNIYEIITIPVPRFYTVTYEVTFWCQYIQQMNQMLEYLMSSYVHNPSLTFRLESDKGYWFVARIEPSISPDENFDGFTDEERLVKASFTIEVNGYLINSAGPGVPNPVRRYVSAPYVSFDTSFSTYESPSVSQAPSGLASDYTLENFDELDKPGSGRSVADTTELSYEIPPLLSIGGSTNTVMMSGDSKTDKTEVIVKHRSKRNGETVYRELGKLQT